jgi:hypothetical protein
MVHQIEIIIKYAFFGTGSSPTIVHATMVKMTQLEELNNPSPTIAENNFDAPYSER